MSAKTAKQLARMEGWRGDAYVYEVDPPMSYTEEYDGPVLTTPYVIVSASVVSITGPETYIFPAKKTGDVFEVADWGELDGSFRGGLDRAEALANAGYVVSS